MRSCWRSRAEQQGARSDCQALADLRPDEITITAEQNVLTVEGRKAEKAQREFLYQGISSRPFKRRRGGCALRRLAGLVAG